MSSRKSVKDYTGFELREALKKAYFQGEYAKQKFTIAYKRGEALIKSNIPFGTTDEQIAKQFTYEKISGDKKLRNNEGKYDMKKVRRNDRKYENIREELSEKIKVPCRIDSFGRRSLPIEGWASDAFDELITGFYFQKMKRILRIYYYNTKHYGAFAASRTAYNKQLKTYRPYLNIFLSNNGIHFNVLKRKENVKAEDIKKLLYTHILPEEEIKKYFSEETIVGDGFCYFSAIATAVRIALEEEKASSGRLTPFKMVEAEGAGSEKSSRPTTPYKIVDLINDEGEETNTKMPSKIVDLVSDDKGEGTAPSRAPRSTSEVVVDMLSSDEEEGNYKEGTNNDNAIDLTGDDDKKNRKKRKRELQRSFEVALKF